MLKYFLRLIITLFFIVALVSVIKSGYNIFRIINIREYGINKHAIIIEKIQKDGHSLILQFEDNNKAKVTTNSITQNLWKNKEIGDSITIKFSSRYPNQVFIEGGDIEMQKQIWNLILSIVFGSILIIALIKVLNTNFELTSGRKIRGTDKPDFIESVKQLNDEGIKIPLEHLEAHYLSRGNINNLVNILIKMKREGEEINIDHAIALDFLEQQENKK